MVHSERIPYMVKSYGGVRSIPKAIGKDTGSIERVISPPDLISQTASEGNYLPLVDRNKEANIRKIAPALFDLTPPVTWLQCPTRAVISDLHDNAIFLRIVKKLPNIKQ